MTSNALRMFSASVIGGLLVSAALGDAPGAVLVHQAAIEAMTGRVEVQAGGSGPWRDVVAGERLRMNDRLRTGPKSSCRLRLGDIGVFELAARSEARIGTLRQDRSESPVRDIATLHLARGISRQGFLRIPGRIGDYRVVTPVAAAGVRGTTFEMGLSGEADLLDCAVLDGSVVVQGSAGGQAWSRILVAGSAIQVRANAAPGPPSPAAPEQLQGLWEIQSLAQQTDSALPPVPEAVSGSAALGIEPGDFTLNTQGRIQGSFQNRSLSITNAGAARSIRVSIAGTPMDMDLVLAVGRDFSFTRRFEAYPITIGGAGRVASADGRIVVTFQTLQVSYVEEGAMDVYRLPCVVTTDQGGAGSFQLVITPGEEVEVE